MYSMQTPQNKGTCVGGTAPIHRGEANGSL
jgi:hypothetical protein